MRTTSDHPRSLALKSNKTPLHISKISALLLAASLMLVPASSAQQAQTSAPPTHHVPGLSPNPGEPDNTMAQMTERMARERNADRQKEIVADTARLLKLAQQLNVDVSKSNKNTLSLAVVKDAGEIEKLAKEIKNKMKNEY